MKTSSTNVAKNKEVGGEKLYLLRVEYLWDENPETIGVYTKEGLEKAKEILTRNRGTDPDRFLVDEFIVDQMPWDQEKYNAEKAAEWLNNPTLEN